MNPPTADAQSPAADPAAGISAPEKRIPGIRSEDLFGEAEEVLIEHGGRIYCLRKGPYGGLVLTA